MEAILYCMALFASHPLSNHWRLPRRGLVLGAVCLAVLGCEQASEPIASPSHQTSPASPPATAGAPREGLGQRLGTDVTSQPGRGSAPSHDDRPVIVAFGNSLTAGLGVPVEEAYPSHLQRRLDATGFRFRIINAGVSGDTTAGGVRRVDWVLSSRPSVVILELGANDGLRGIDLEQTRANLEQIITRLQSAGVTVVLTGLKLPPNYGAEYTRRFAAMYPELARRYRLALMPFFLEGVATHTGLNQADGIHPTGAGYRVVVEHLMPVLEPLLAKAVPGIS